MAEVRTGYDYSFKILLVGNSGCGKTCFILRFTEDKFSEKFISTVGIDFKIKTIDRQGRKIKLQVSVICVFSRVLATLQLAILVGRSVARSVGWSVGWSLGRLAVSFLAFSAFLRRLLHYCPCPNA